MSLNIHFDMFSKNSETMILPFRDRDFQWGGCSHDVSFGTKFRSGNNLTMRKVITLQFRAVTWKQLGGSIIIFDFSQEFVDAEEKDQIVLHNNEVGLADQAGTICGTFV